MKQTKLYIITALCLQTVMAVTLLSCSTENDEYKKDSPLAGKACLLPQELYLKISP